MMKTYSRETWLKARQAWTDGEFGDEWEPYRLIAAERGFISPPTGTQHDDRDVGQPSQRAVIWRAIQDTPRWLLSVVAHASSWSQVVAAIVAHESAMREDADLLGGDADAERSERPSRSDATEALRSILGRIA